MSILDPSDPPYRHYWRSLYPQYADPEATARWYGKWKTAESCMSLFAERQRLRQEWFANHSWRKGDPHVTAVATAHASPVRSITAKVCLHCLWVSGELGAEHPEH